MLCRIDDYVTGGARSDNPKVGGSNPPPATKKSLIVMPELNAKFVKSAANIPGVKTALVNTMNVYDILNCEKFIVAKAAVEKIEEVYA